MPELIDSYTESRYDWDVPFEGLRFHRTLEEAFGPGAHLYQPRPFITITQLNYIAATILVIASLVLAVVPTHWVAGEAPVKTEKRDPAVAIN